MIWPFPQEMIGLKRNSLTVYKRIVFRMVPNEESHYLNAMAATGEEENPAVSQLLQQLEQVQLLTATMISS